MTEQSNPGELPAHVSNQFLFVMPVPLDRAAPLFGPEGERGWAGPDWCPRFLYPLPARDTQGAVFTVQQGRDKSVLANTLFDLAGGRMQYVSFVSEKLVSIIDVRLRILDATSTLVDVTYARTALHSSANDEVQLMGKNDRAQGPRWQQAIESYLKT